MKPARCSLYVMMVVVSSSVLAQSKGEMQITTSLKGGNKLLRNAWAALADFKIDEGNAIIRQLLKEDPDCAIAYASLWVETDDERNENLRKAFEKKMSADEKMFIEAIHAVVRKENPSQYLEPLIRKYPSDNYLHLWTMFWNQDPMRGIEIGENLIKRNPKFAPANNLLGYLYMNTNNPEKAEANFNKYIALRPDLANTYDSKGDYFMHVGKTQEAITMFEKAHSMGMAASKPKIERAKSMLKFPKLSDADADGIKRMILTSFEAYTKADLEGIVKPYAEQSVEIHENQMSNIGLVNAENRVKEMYKYGSFLKHELTFEFVNGNGPIAIAYGKNPSIWKSKDSGKEYNRTDNAIFLLRKQGDGHWKILVDHFYQRDENAATLSDNDKDQINQLFRQWDAAMKPGDVFGEKNIQAMTAMFSPQAVELSSNQRANVGIANLQARWSEGAGIKIERNSLGPIGFEGSGRRAVAWGIGNQAFYGKDSEVLTQNEFAWAMILTKEKDDVWRILSVHWAEN